VREDSSSASATDALGSVRLTLDNNGTAYSGATYDPWGSPERGSVGTFGFTGELQQGDQVYLRARWYNANNGTFTSIDPFAGFPQQPYSLHPYQYGYSAPTVFTDPSGRCVPEWVPLIGENGCTLSAGIGQGRIDWEAGNKVVQAVSEPFIQLGEAAYQDIKRSPSQRVDDYINHLKQNTPLGLLSGDPLAIPLGPFNIRFFWDPGEVFVNSAVALGSDLTCGDPYRFLRGLSTIERDLLLAKLFKGGLARFGSSHKSNGSIYFRGTSEGYTGNPGLQRIGISPASTDPLVATIYATEAENFGKGVVHIATSADLKGVTIGEGNVLRKLELEVGVEVPPVEFASRSSITITATQARTILQRMGISVPSLIDGPADVRSVLYNTPRLTSQQIVQFVKMALEMQRD
jgi:RHS repeat-associated protein